KCKHCDKHFSDNNNLIAHVETHTVEKPHQCNHYDKAHVKDSPLISHLREDTDDKPYQCSHGDITSEKSNLIVLTPLHFQVNGSKSFTVTHKPFTPEINPGTT
ncbi:unnamed protein product, partial [Meganyctiphanes norvegica]